ncbi:hypothetical protein BBJ28_00017678 [Nothophytophthora sp. Chile5]|nr:hypothetical protein BBJ28_00017678 [Nothophytophthora sp. Chile5]
MDRPPSEGSALLPRHVPLAPTQCQLHISKTSPRHVSPRKFQQLQQEKRTKVLRGMPLSPLSARRKLERAHTSEGSNLSPRRHHQNEFDPWNLGWLPRSPTGARNDAEHRKTNRRTSRLVKEGGAAGLSYAATMFDEWLESYEREFLVFESLEKFFHVKVPEALAFCEKAKQQPSTRGSSPSAFRFQRRLRVSVFAHLMERTIAAMAQSASFAHPQTQTLLLQARQELFRAIFADYDTPIRAENDQSLPSTSRRRRRTTESGSADDEAKGGDSDTDGDSNDDTSSSPPTDPSSPSLSDSTTPRTLSFFLSKIPYALKVQDDSQHRALHFKRDQTVLRRIVQTMYQSLGTMFHAWQQLVRRRKEERMQRKGAQLTAMIVMQRGLKRSVFVEWTKVTLHGKLHALQAAHLEQGKQHQKALAELRHEIFLLHEKNAALQAAQRSTTQQSTSSSSSKPGVGDADQTKS